MRFSTRFLVLGAMTGLLAPTALFAYAELSDVALNLPTMFLVLAVGGAVTFGSLLAPRWS